VNLHLWKETGCEHHSSLTPLYLLQKELTIFVQREWEIRAKRAEGLPELTIKKKEIEPQD